MLYNLDILQIVSIILSVTALVFLAFFWRRLSALQKFQKRFFLSKENIDLEEIILSQQENLKRVTVDIQKLSQANKILADLEQKCIQRIGMVRFSPFSSEGGNQSFAIALLDAYGTGVVISSIYGRDSQRVYAKPVKNNESHMPLTEEEKRAILESQEIETIADDSKAIEKATAAKIEKPFIKRVKRSIKRTK
jgi:hypothetical protein